MVERDTRLCLSVWLSACRTLHALSRRYRGPKPLGSPPLACLVACLVAYWLPGCQAGVEPLGAPLPACLIRNTTASTAAA
jgi:hypothetical protein